MTKNNPRPNDNADNKEILKKTISNMEAAEEAIDFAERDERTQIKEKNNRRKERIDDLQQEIHAEAEARRKKY